VSRLLKEGGEILIFEIHPVAYLFDYKEAGLDKPFSYFDKGPYHYKNGMDYVGGVQYEAKECFWFMHKMSDILSAILHNGIEIQEFDEYNLEMANSESAKLFDKFPLSYILTGKK
jgi:hypothetical protein